MFTGNNIGPRGDSVSRGLQSRLCVNQPDPENRDFKHPDPIGWTLANRGKILEALYIVLLGNPQLKKHNVPETRFKAWWHLVGAAVEHAASLVQKDKDPTLRFKDLFSMLESEEEQTTGLAEVLQTIQQKWPGGTQAGIIALHAGESTAFRAAMEQAIGKPLPQGSISAYRWLGR
ncbi:MAG: hypothetical protein JO110_09240 [Acetobacteraceae bacterium]|nr:hypothetical protein [Acetobacteraceae bacterium]